MTKFLKAYFQNKVRSRRIGAFLLGLFAVFYVLSAVAVVSVDTIPLTVANTVPGNLVLVPSVEWPTVVTLANDPGKGDNTSGYAGYTSATTTSCPSGYTLSSGSCSLTVAATANCSSGTTLNGAGNSCSQVVSATPTACPTGSTLNGANCVQNAPPTVATCPSGSTLSGGSCLVITSATIVSCPSGSTLSSAGTSCLVITAASAKTCPSGSTLSSGSCLVTVTATFACPTGYTASPTGTIKSTTTCTLTKQSSCPLSGYPKTSGSGTNLTCSGKATTATSCTNIGATLSGSNCLGPGTVTPSTYTCASGTLSGSNCLGPSTATPSSYSCPITGAILSGSSCLGPATATPASYSCSSGFTLNGSVCSTPQLYSCPSGGTLGGTGSASICTTLSTPTYTCASGTLSGTNCTITQSASIQSTPYVGYFNSSLCYAYSYDVVEANRYFYPVSNTTTDSSNNAYSCAGQTGGTPVQNLWSGNFLNWASMQAIDTFRLALTGGLRVNRPAEGPPPKVTIIGADGNLSAPLNTGDQPGTTYLEKATTDRWTSPYTDTRSLSANGANSTPFTATINASNTFITRVGGLRNQMWFMPYSSSKTNLGSAGGCCSATNAIDLPVSSTTQTESTRQTSGAVSSAVAIPYNPTYDTLPNLATASNTNSTPCGTSPVEYGCTTTLWNCPSGGANGSQTATTGDTDGTCSSTATPAACPTSGNVYYNSGTTKCQPSSGTTTGATNNLCPTGWNFPTNGSGNNRTCSLTSYTGTGSTFAHPGRDLIYAVSIRVKVCDGTWDTRSMCSTYANGHSKPEGLMQSNATKTRFSLFSYLTENDSNGKRVGGVMRARQKLIGPVITGEQPYPERSGRSAGIDNPEWDSVTGVFINDPDSTDSAYTTGKIGGCTSSATPDGSACVVQYSGVINYLNRFGELGTGLGSTSTTYTSDPLSTLKAYDNLSELYYSAISYLRGLGNNAPASKLDSTSGYTTTNVLRYQNADGFPVIEDWYQNGANAAVTTWNSITPALTVGQPADPILYSCQTTAVLGIGDTNTNSESDTYSSDTGSTMGGTNGPFKSTVLTTWRGYLDSGASSALGSKADIAALAYWGHLNDLRTDIPNYVRATSTVGQTISTYWVDVVEKGDFKTNTTNQYYNATKYGGFNIPNTAWDTNGDGNAQIWDVAGSVVPSANWFTATQSAWTNNTTTWYNGTSTPNSTGGSGWYNQPSNMFFANNGANMIAGLNAAFTKIQADANGSGSSLAANSTQRTVGATTYQASYVSSSWSGDLAAYAITSTGSINSAPLWNAAKMLPATTATAASRVIKTSTDGTATGVVDFSATLPATSPLRTALGATSTVQNNVINYLRGDPSTTTFRSRITALGDIVDSQPVFLGASDPNIYYGKTFTGSATYATYASGTLARKTRVWVAANDGMLHAFNSDCAITATSGTGSTCPSTTPAAGTETFAYLPNAVLTKTPIKNLTDPLYGSSTDPHLYFNDGELTIADVYFTSDSKWHAVLVGTTGRGLAKAVYALDVTDPTTTPSLLWERSAGDGKGNDGYIGQMTGKPIIAQTANGTWSVLIGNGYNSTQNTAALLQFAISDGTLTVHTTSSTLINNGLAAPAVWIANPTNNISTEAYAGDLFGNVWHFDLTTSTGNVVFKAQDSTPTAQPITDGMLIGKDPETANVWLFFGTGRFLTHTDLTDKSVQTWYGIIVEGTNAVTSTSTRSSLAVRTIAAQQTVSSTVFERAITVPTPGDLTGKSGWYMDLKFGTALGERMVTPNQFQGSLLLGTTRIPTSSDPCNPSGSGTTMVFNPFTGTPPSSSFFDVNGNGTVGTDDLMTDANGVSYVVAGIGFNHAPNDPIFVGNSMLLSFDDASTKSYLTAGTVGLLKRLTWRELVTQ